VHELLIVHHGDDWLRGSERCLLALVAALDRTRFRPMVVCNQPTLAAALERGGIEHHRLRMPEVRLEVPRPRLPLAGYTSAFRKLRQIACRRPFALVYANAGVSCQLGGPIARSLGLASLCHVHAGFTRRHYWSWLLPLASSLVFVSDAIRRSSLASLGFRGRVHTVPNGIDLRRFRPATPRDPAVRAALGVPPDEPLLAQVGSLIPRKGVDVLLRAFARGFHGAPGRLLLVGEGPERPALERLADELGVAGRVIFAGEVASPERLLAHAVDVHVLASRSEAWGLSVAEAAACGVPSVCSDREGLAELVRDGVTGLRVPAEDPEALAAQLERLAGDAGLRARLGRAARAHVERSFSLEAWIAALEAEIEATIAAAARTRRRS
jgi:glycosyltransferase involved in cell wall biosynthesis